MLLPHPFTKSAHSTSSTNHLPEQSREFSSITISPLSENLPSPSTRTSDMTIRTPLLEPHNSVQPLNQRSESASADALAAINDKNQHLVQATPPQSRRMSSFSESMPSAHSSKYSRLQPKRSPCASPGSSSTNEKRASGTYIRQQGDLHEAQHLAQRPVRPSSWPNAHNHPG